MTPAELLSILKCLSKDTPRHTSRLELHTGVISEQQTTCEGLSAAFWLTVWTWTGLDRRWALCSMVCSTVWSCQLSVRLYLMEMSCDFVLVGGDLRWAWINDRFILQHRCGCVWIREI